MSENYEEDVDDGTKWPRLNYECADVFQADLVLEIKKEGRNEGYN